MNDNYCSGPAGDDGFDAVGSNILAVGINIGEYGASTASDNTTRRSHKTARRNDDFVTGSYIQSTQGQFESKCPICHRYSIRNLAQFRHPALEGTVKADVCVVGGGFSGIATALSLAEKGRRVVVLEAHRVGWGASGRNGGQCIAGISGEAEIERRNAAGNPPEVEEKLAQSHAKALRLLAEFRKRREQAATTTAEG